MTDNTAHAEKTGCAGNFDPYKITLSGETPLVRKNTTAGSAKVNISSIVFIINRTLSPAINSGRKETVNRSVS